MKPLLANSSTTVHFDVLVRLVVVLLVTSSTTITGCFRAQQEPLDDNCISLAARGRLFNASIRSLVDRRLVEIDDEKLASSLLLTLVPISSVKIGEFPADTTIDYQFIYQCGRNPLFFLVNISDGKLMYQQDKYLYTGGDSKKFRDCVSKIFAKQEEKDAGEEKVPFE